MADATVEEKSELDGFSLVNLEKLDRAIHGLPGRDATTIGGLPENPSDAAILAEYDRLGGLIMKAKNKVKTGSFYDFKLRQPRSEPEVLLIFKDIYGNTVELPPNAPKPIEVEAAEKIAENKKAKADEVAEAKAAKKAAATKKPKKPVEDEDEE